MTSEGVAVQPIRDARRGTLAGVEARTTSVTSALGMLPLLPPDAWLEINVSTGFLTRLELSALFGVPKDERRRVVMQISACAPVADHSFLNAATDVFRDQGVRFAVGHVGAGYTSLSQVLLSRPDFVTIDPSLMRGVGGDRVNRALVCAVIDVARTVGARVIASGVDAAEDLAAVVTLGVDLAQGHLIGHPTTNQAIVRRWSCDERSAA